MQLFYPAHIFPTQILRIILNGFFRYQVIKWRQLRVGRYDFDHHGLSSCSLDSWWYSGVKEYYRSLLGRQHRRSRWRLKAVYTDISDNSKPHENQRPGHLKAFSSLERKSQMIFGWFQRVEISTLGKSSIILKGSFDIYASIFCDFLVGQFDTYSAPACYCFEAFR